MFKDLFKRLSGKSATPAPTVATPTPVPPIATRSANEIATDFACGKLDAEAATVQMTVAMQDEKYPAFGLDGSPALMQVCSRRGGAKMAQILVSKKADVNLAVKDGTTPLMRAAQTADPETLAVLLDAGANVKTTRTEPPRASFGDFGVGGGTRDVFHDVIINMLDEPDAIKTARRDCLKLLMERGHQPSQNDLFSVYCNRPHLRPLFPGMTEARVITDAAERGDMDMVNEMLSRGVKPDCAAAYGANTALVEAIGKGHIEIVKRLLDAGADINLQSPQHNVLPLDKAVQCENPELFDLLLERGADPKDARSYSIPRLYDTSELALKHPHVGPEISAHVKQKLAERDLTLQKPVTVGKPLKITPRAKSL